MLKEGNYICQFCGGEMQSRGMIKRKIKLGNDEFRIIRVPRYSCKKCGKWQRVLLKGLEPYKQYPKEIINGFQKDILSTGMIEYENYPCEMTVKRWKSH